MNLSKLLLVDGNSILNRAFYGIMGNKMLMTPDGTYTNAVYGFLAILFKVIEEINPTHIVVAFDLKAPTQRHKMYEGYKATRKGMPQELVAQLPIIKEVLQAMNIKIIEKEGYEADDILGTLSVYGEEKGLEVVILSGDRDTFQLATDNVTIHIPRTKMGKTEVDDFDRKKVEEIYGVNPKQLIEVKGLQGDSSDNIPGVPGIGEKTALSLIQKYGSIDSLYEKIQKGEDDVKGKARENLINHKDLALLSRSLGTINLEVPIDLDIEEYKVEQWDKQKVLELFQKLRFNRYIDRFELRTENLQNSNIAEEKISFTIVEKTIQEIKTILQEQKELFYSFATKTSNQPEEIIKKKIEALAIYNRQTNEVYEITEKDSNFFTFLKELFEEKEIKKFGYQLAQDYILLKQIGVQPNGFVYDAEIAVYDVDPTNIKYQLEEVAKQYLDLDMEQYLSQIEKNKPEQDQMNLFDTIEEEPKQSEYDKQYLALCCFVIVKLYEHTRKRLEQDGEKKLFETIEMPLVEVLAEMQYQGMYVDKTELEEFGRELKSQLQTLTQEIYHLAGEEFNINSPKQLGEILFDKLQLTVHKKTKSGYSTAEDVLEKLYEEHPIIAKILEYRSLSKLNSTYVEGLIPYINPSTGKIHSYFHQTITATGRISSTEPNLQNIPTRIELGKRLRKVFKPANGYIYIDADYSQIELRVLAHISKDENMIHAFLNHEDIHKQAASKVLNIPIEEVTKEQRSHAKAVNFGIVYGISDFGLAQQLGVSRKKAKEYIDQYLEKYSGIKQFMDDIVELAKKQGYVETLFHRRRYIPEIQSSNYNIRQFGARAAMNTPIQGTAADIMKIAMIQVYQELKNNNLKSKLVLQVHDELIIETAKEETQQVKDILKDAMENAIHLDIPLEIEMSEAKNWYEAK